MYTDTFLLSYLRILHIFNNQDKNTHMQFGKRMTDQYMLWDMRPAIQIGRTKRRLEASLASNNNMFSKRNESNEVNGFETRSIQYSLFYWTTHSQNVPREWNPTEITINLAWLEMVIIENTHYFFACVLQNSIIFDTLIFNPPFPVIIEPLEGNWQQSNEVSIWNKNDDILSIQFILFSS